MTRKSSFSAKIWSFWPFSPVLDRNLISGGPKKGQKAPLGAQMPFFNNPVISLTHLNLSKKGKKRVFFSQKNAILDQNRVFMLPLRLLTHVPKFWPKWQLHLIALTARYNRHPKKIDPLLIREISGKWPKMAKNGHFDVSLFFRTPKMAKNRGFRPLFLTPA